MRWWWQPPCLLREVVINPKHDPAVAIKGLLWASRGPWLVIHQPTLFDHGETKTADGELVIHRDNVAFIQVP
jgi:hypothetical protein